MCGVGCVGVEPATAAAGNRVLLGSLVSGDSERETLAQHDTAHRSWGPRNYVLFLLVELQAKSVVQGIFDSRYPYCNS